MPLDGLRAWIGEVERKLGMRTRVFLVLATIAIGGAGAAIYLALDTRDEAVSESDVRALQERLEEQIATGGAPDGTALDELESEDDVPDAEGDLPDGIPGGIPGDVPGASPEEPPTGGATDPESLKKLREVLEKTKQRRERAEEGK